MKLYGKDFFFAKTVGAVCKIQKLIRDCGKDGKLFTDDMPYWQSQENAARYMAYLHEGYVNRQRQEALEMGHEFEEPVQIGPDALMDLDETTFNALFVEAVKVYTKDATTVKGAVTKTGKKTELK